MFPGSILTRAFTACPYSRGYNGEDAVEIL